MALTTIEPFGINSSNSFTFANVTATGNITGNFFIGNGSQLTGLPESYSNANVAAYLPTYTGNISADNITANTFAGNITGGSNTASTVTASAQPNITSVGTLTSVSSTGNITGAYFIGNGSQLTGLPESYTNANVAAYLPTYTGNLVSLQGNVTTTANISASHVLGNGSGLSSITGANVTGQVANAQVAGTVYTAAQPNITSVGTLTSVSVSGNLTAGNIASDAHVAAATLQTTGNAIIGGDLVVNGNTIQVNIDQLNVQDPIIGLGRGANNAPLTSNDGKDRGTEMWYYTDAEKSAFVGYQNSTGNIIAASNISMANEIVTVNSYGNFVAGNVIGAAVSATGNITGNYFVGNGSQLTGLPEGYANADVAAYLPTYTGNLIALTGDVTTTANVTGNYILGNGSQLTGLPEGYANANVAAYLPTYTGNLASLTGNVTTTANVTGNYILGNGSQLTGLPEGYANADVAAYLPTYTGNLASLTGNVTTTANVSANYFLGNGSQLTGIQAGATTTFSSAAPSSPAQGDIWIDADTGIQYIYFNDGTSSQWAEMEAQTSFSGGSGGNVDFGSVAANILPASDVTYDLGSATYRWRDIYLSGNTINLGGATIKTDAASGAIALIPEPTVANPNPSGMVVSPSGGITVVSTVGGAVSGNAIADAATAPTATPVPIDITTNVPLNGQALLWSTANAVFAPGNVSSSGSSITVYTNIGDLPLSGVSTGAMAFVSGNNRLYLWNGTGWFNIALINTNPTITGGLDPTYLFAIDGTPLVLTLIASDPEGIPLTWSYQVTSGVLGNTATISQANNVFTITPSTQDADAGVFEITFSASDGVNLGTAAASFTLAFGAADPYYNQSILLSTTSTNNGTNNTFVDSSGNNVTVTRNGNTTQGAFSAFSPAGWSGFFDGAGDYLTVPYSTIAFDWWTDNYTVEAWVYPTSFTGWSYLDGANIKPTLIGNNVFNSTTNYWSFGLTTTGSVHFAYFNGAAQGAGTSSTATLNAWNHIAMVKNGTNVTLYLNGVGTSIGDVSGTPQSSSGTALTIGAGNSAYINGYVSNLRIVKGTAIYTSNFSVPPDPLSAVSGTSLLTLKSNSLVDNSGNNYAITRNGNVSVSPYAPFRPRDDYSTADNGGSAYFDGTGDYLSATVGSAPGTGDFTFEAWAYVTNLSAGRLIFTTRSGNTTDGLQVQLSSVGQFRVGFAGSDFITTASGTGTTNQWYHVAVTRASGTVTLWVNGVSLGTSVRTNDFTSTAVRLGLSAENLLPMLGYISNARYVVGTAIYTSAFTPPTQPVTAVSGTALLVNTVNANIYDQTGKIDLETLGDAKTSTAVVKYGTTSMAFDGTGDLITYPGGLNGNFGTGDFTIESWSYLTSAGNLYRTIFGMSYPTSKAVFLRYGNDGFGQKLQVAVQGDTTATTWSTSLTQTASLNQWIHLAFTRSSGVCRLFVNGVLQNINSGANPSTYPVTSFTDSANIVNAPLIQIGADNYAGYLSDVRITQGVARYTANFTPPTAQLGFNNPE